MANAKRNHVPAKIAKVRPWFRQGIEPIYELAVEGLFSDVATLIEGIKRIGEPIVKAAPDEELAPEGNPLAVHLLESLTFVSEIQDAVVEEFRTTLRMFLGEFTETRAKFVAHFRHRPPPSCDFFQIVFLANAEGDRSINAEKMLLQIAGFRGEGRAEIGWYFAQPSFRFLESCARQL